MSERTPSYQRNQGYTPQTQSSGIQQASTRMAQAFQTGTKESFLDQIAQHIGQTVANDYAQKAGVEAAKTPGRHFIAIGESGRHFVDAYKKEELQSVDFEGNKFLTSIYREAAGVKNPSGQTLSDFQENALAGIDHFSNSVSAEARPSMKRKLMDTYTDAFGKLSHKVEQANFDRLKSQNNIALSQNLTMMTDAFLEGNEARGNAIRDQSSEQLKRMSSLGLITPEQAFKMGEALTKESIMSTYNGKMLEAAREGKGPDYLKELRDSETLSKLTPSQKMSVLDGARSTLAHYEAASAEKDYLIKGDLLSKLETGQLSESEAQDGMEQLGPRDRAEVQHAIAKMSAKQLEVANTNAFIYNNAENPMALSERSDKEISSATQSLWNRQESQRGEPLTLEEKAQTVAGIKAPNKIMTEQLSAAMSSLDANLIADASRAIGILNERNPLALEGLSSKKQEQAIEINQAIRGNMGVQQAIESAIGRPEGVTPEEYERNQMAVKETARMWGGIAAQRQQTKNILGVPDSMVTPELEMALYNQVTGTQLRIGDRNLANEMAKVNINKSWGPSNAMGGKAKYMRNAPEKFVDGGDEIARHQVINQVHSIIEELGKSDETGFHYEFDVPKSEIKEGSKGIISSLSPIIDKALFNPDEIKIRQVFTEPERKVIEGNLVMRSDTQTANVGSGVLPSYALYIQTDEGLKPVMDKDYQPVRYTLDPFSYEKEVAETHRKTIEEKIERKSELQKIRRSNKTIEPLPHEAI